MLWLTDVMKRMSERRLARAQPQGTFVLDAEIERTEELRTDRLGPDEDDLNGMPRDKWRPVRTLGILPWNRH